MKIKDIFINILGKHQNLNWICTKVEYKMSHIGAQPLKNVKQVDKIKNMEKQTYKFFWDTWFDHAIRIRIKIMT